MKCSSIHIVLLASALIFNAACATGNTSVHEPDKTATGSPDFPIAQQTPKVPKEDPKLLCSRISEIKEYPLKGERGVDPIYDSFMQAGDAVIPCLIDRVTDDTVMTDPRSEPGFPDIEIKVGDIAYFLLVDLAKIDFTAALPPQVKQSYKDQGVYAYFQFVKKRENRKKIQKALLTWWQNKNRNPE